MGRLLLDRGRLEDAERYFQSRYQYDWEYYVPAQYYLGQILEARGQRAEAAMHYGRFVTWWRDCDPALRPWWEAGRNAMRRLGGEPR